MVSGSDEGYTTHFLLVCQALKNTTIANWLAFDGINQDSNAQTGFN